MRRRIYIAFLMGLAALRGRGSDDAATWLIGTWKSNRELTVPTVQLDRPLSPDKKTKFENLFGNMTVMYTATDIHFQRPAFEKYPPWSAVEPYRVIAATSMRLVIRHTSPRTGKDESSIINFESRDRYWIDLSLGEVQGVKGREYFDRVSLIKVEPNKAPDRTAPSVTPSAAQEPRH